MKETPTEELLEKYTNFYILLESSLLGEKFDIIKCICTKEGHTQIIKADGLQHFFASSITYGIENKWFVPFSHIEFAKLHGAAILEAAGDCAYEGCYDGGCQCSGRKQEIILNSYSLENIK